MRITVTPDYKYVSINLLFYAGSPSVKGKKVSDQSLSFHYIIVSYQGLSSTPVLFL